VKCQRGVATKGGRDAIAVEWNRCQSSPIDALGKLTNATLMLESVQHIKDRTAVGLRPVALAEFAEREKRRGLHELSEGYVVWHRILTYIFIDTLKVCLYDID
jgi:hypothetical protein